MKRHIWRRRFIRFASVALAIVLVVLTGSGPAAAETPREQQWYLDRINVRLAHEATLGEGIVVGMLLSAVNAEHPDLQGRVLPTRYVDRENEIREQPGEPGRDVDTALAGLVVADGPSGLVGVAPRAKIQPVKSPTSEEQTSSALRWLVDQGVKVIDMSDYSAVFRLGLDGIRYALARDVVVIISADVVEQAESVPPGVLVVGGVNRDDSRSPVASSGNISIAAPGSSSDVLALRAEPGPLQEKIFVAPADQQAAAIVTGAAALVRARHPELNAPSVVNRLLRTARDLGPPGPDEQYGHGIVDAGAAVSADVPAVTENPLGDPGPPQDASPARPHLGYIVLAAVCLGAVLLTVAAATLLVVRQRRRRAARQGPPPIGPVGPVPAAPATSPRQAPHTPPRRPPG